LICFYNNLLKVAAGYVNIDNYSLNQTFPIEVVSLSYQLAKLLTHCIAVLAVNASLSA